MNLGVGMTLIVAMFPERKLKELHDSEIASRVYMTTRAGIFRETGYPFMVVAPRDIPERIKGLFLRRVFMTRGAALSFDQLDTLRSRHRYNTAENLFDFSLP